MPPSKGARPSVNKQTSLNTTEPLYKFDFPPTQADTPNHGVQPCILQIPFDVEELPEACRDSYNTHRYNNTAAAKLKVRETFITECLAKGLHQRWTLGLEPPPPFAQDLKRFRKEYADLKKTHSQEVMTLLVGILKDTQDHMAEQAEMASDNVTKTVEKKTRGDDKQRLFTRASDDVKKNAFKESLKVQTAINRAIANGDLTAKDEELLQPQSKPKDPQPVAQGSKGVKRPFQDWGAELNKQSKAPRHYGHQHPQNKGAKAKNSPRPQPRTARARRRKRTTRRTRNASTRRPTKRTSDSNHAKSWHERY